MPLTPGARYVASRKKKKFAREKLYLFMPHADAVPIPMVLTGFRADLSGNLMLFHQGRIKVYHVWYCLEEADFENPADQRPDEAPADDADGTEPA